MYQAQKKLALGKATPKKGTALVVQPKTVEERVDLLEAMVKNLLRINADLVGDKADSSSNAYNTASLNKQGIPVGTCLIGTVRGGVPRVLSVTKDGYFVGTAQFSSLSSAAEAVSGIVRKSGWVFWKLPDGRTAKEAFKNRT
jgi:hypothetical protein